jgi:hypothetical protein
LLGCPFTAVAKTSHTLAHSEVIHELIEVLDKPFWLVDHDCYVLDVKALHEERQKLGTCAGLTEYRTNTANGGLKFQIPKRYSNTSLPADFYGDITLNANVTLRSASCANFLCLFIPIF